MRLKQVFIPLRISKGLLCLIAMFVMLLAPQVAWATVFTTSTLTEATEGDAKYTWTVEGLGAFSVNPKYDWDENGVNMSSNPIGITVGGYYGCTLSLKGAVPNDPDNYNNIIYKVKIIGVNDNSDITVSLDKTNGDDVTFIASTEPGEFYVPNSVIWASNEELSIEVGKECTITGIEVYRSTVSTETSYGFQGNPISNGPIQGALQEDQTIAINLFNYQGYYYPLYVNGSTNTSTNITYSSSNESVATVSSDGSVNIKKTGSTTIIATVQDNNDNLTFGYTLTVNFPAPTISPNGGHQLANAEITFGYEGATNTPDFKYKWGENGETISYGTAHPTVQTGTLTAWVEVMPSGSQTAIKSEEATATFTAVPGTSYGLTVGGIPVTSENCDNVLGDERQDHQVIFDNDSHKLTLNNANLSGNIVSDINLEVEFIGSNHIDLSEASGDYAFIGNGTANLSFTNTGKDVNPLTIMFGSGLMSNWGTESVDVNTEEERDEKDDWWLNSNTGTSCEFKLMYNEKFDLWIGKDENTQIQVCNFNKDNVVNDNSWDNHSVSFEPATEYSPATLILNSYQSETNTTQPFITNGISELDIMLKGNNQIHSGALFLTNSKANTNNIVTFTTEISNPGHLTIRAHGEEGAAWSSGHTINYENGLVKVSEYYDNETYSANTVMIEMPEAFGVTVAGTLITPENLSNVLSGENNNKVSFDPNNNILYLQGASIAGDIETSLDNLTISVSEANTLTGSVKYNGENTSATLTIDANLEHANSASLVLSSKEIGVISGFNTVTVNSPLETTVTDWTSDVKNATIAAECYDIRIAGVLVTKANKDNVLGTPEGTDPTVSFTPAVDAVGDKPATPATLTLNNATIDLTEMEGPGILYTGSTALTIELIGANSIMTQFNSEPILCDISDNTKPALTFEAGSRPCFLELLTSGYTSVFKGFENVFGVNGIGDETGKLLTLDSEDIPSYDKTNGLYTYDNDKLVPVTSAMITFDYGLTVGGVIVNEANASDIFDGDATNDGKVSYDLATNTLTLNGATIGGGAEAYGIVYRGTDDLTISLKGTNTISGTGGCETILYDGNANGAPKLIFDKGDNNECSLQLSAEGDKTVIEGFGDVQGAWGLGTVDNGLAVIADNQVKYSQTDGLQIETVVNNTVNYVALSSTQIVSYYGLAISGVPVYQGNMENITGSGISGTGSASYEPTKYTLTLNNINLNPDYGQNEDVNVSIVTSLAQLNIDLIGESQSYAIKATDENCAVTFNSAEANRGAARLNFWYDAEPYFIGFGENKVTYNDGLCLRQSSSNTSFPNIVALDVPKVVTEEDEYGLYYPDHEFTFSLDREVDGFDIYYANMLGGDPVKTTDGKFTLGVGSYVLRAYPIYSGMDTDPSKNWQFASEISAKVIAKPTFTVPAGTYHVEQTVYLENIPEQNTNTLWDPELEQNIEYPQVWYYLNDNVNDSIRYDAEQGIEVTESCKVSVYIFDEDSSKVLKSKPAEAEYVIEDIPLAVTADDFHNHWMTYYNADGNVALPKDQNIGAYIVRYDGIGETTVTATQISRVPRGEAVLLNDQTTTTTENTSAEGNMLRHADNVIDTDDYDGLIYGLYNGTFMRVSGTISAESNYLLIDMPQAPQLTIVFENEATGINDVRSKKADVRGDFYDLQGRKVEKPSKKGLYINEGHKVVVK